MRPPRPVEWKEDNNGCHIVISHQVSHRGYFKYKRDGKTRTMHRHIYLKYHHMSLNSELVIRHTCDNKKCINIKHLKAGTTQDNVHDRVERNRSAFGERNGRAKLTKMQVLQILKSSQSEIILAQKFKVACSTIAMIRTKRNWRHLS